MGPPHTPMPRPRPPWVSESAPVPLQSPRALQPREDPSLPPHPVKPISADMGPFATSGNLEGKDDE